MNDFAKRQNPKWSVRLHVLVEIGVAAVDAPKDAKPISLGFALRSVKLTPIADGWKSFLASEPGSRLALDIQDISFAQPLNFTYGVYLNLPENEHNEKKMAAHYVGAISFFGRKHVGHAAHEGPTTFTQTLDASKTAARLHKLGKLNVDEVIVTLRPLTAVAPKGMEDQQRRRAEESAKKANVSFKRILLRSVIDRSAVGLR